MLTTKVNKNSILEKDNFMKTMKTMKAAEKALGKRKINKMSIIPSLGLHWKWKSLQKIKEKHTYYIQYRTRTVTYEQYKMKETMNSKIQ